MAWPTTGRFELASALAGPAAEAPIVSWLVLRRACGCGTLSYMKTSTVTIRLDVKLQRDLDRLSRQLGRSRSDLVRDAVRRQIALHRFEQIRRELLPSGGGTGHPHR